MLYCCETWECTVADEVRLRGLEHCIIRMMCGVRLADSMSNDAFHDSVGVVKIEDIIQRCLWWYGHVMHGDINSQIRELMEVEITGKRKKGCPRKQWEDCVKKDLEQYGLRRENTFDQKKQQEQIRAKIA